MRDSFESVEAACLELVEVAILSVVVDVANAPDTSGEVEAKSTSLLKKEGGFSVLVIDAALKLSNTSLNWLIDQ